MNPARRVAILILLSLFIYSTSHGIHEETTSNNKLLSLINNSKSIYGTWYLTPKPFSNESSIPLLRLSVIDIVQLSKEENATMINFTWTDGTPTVIFQDSFKVSHEYREPLVQPITSRIWPYNVYAGIEYNTSEMRSIITTGWVNDGRIVFEINGNLLTQQGVVSSSIAYVIEWESNFDAIEFSATSLHPPALLEYIDYERTPPKTGKNVSEKAAITLKENVVQTGNTYQQEQVVPKKGEKTIVKSSSENAAYVVTLDDQWELTNEEFQMNALVIGLQGLVNRYNGAKLYLRYPPTWAYTYTPMVEDYFKTRHHYNFQVLNSTLDTIKELYKSANVKGYIIYDPTIRESLVVAYTAAGVKNALVVTETQVPLMESLGLSMISNFTGQFEGQTPVEIYSWAKDKYWDQTSKHAMVWAGGVMGSLMHPGIMDYGVSEKCFFTDLSTLPTDTDEYGLASELVSEMGDAFYLLGWHSYSKDFEHTFTTLASKYGGRVHGLNTNPNLSFQSKVKVSPGFVFKNNRKVFSSLMKEEEFVAAKCDEKKTYIVLVQTDGLGLGAWTKPGRGKLPYTWEVTLPDLEIQPALLQMFYEQSTPNDYFIGALGGPGYTYPNAVPKNLLPKRLEMAGDMMEKLDLNSFVIFDASRAVGTHTVTEDTNLDMDVVETYFDTMKNVQGFFNGYAPSFTFSKSNDDRSLISFNYYLDPGRNVEDAVKDLEDLATLNKKRPYFLAIHVREFSTVGKANEIINKLSSETFEVLAGDVFVNLLNKCGNIKTRSGNK